jgi:very-short-patch-repair endonuclease
LDAERMARKALLPQALTHGPFSIEEARRAGVDRRRLEGATWRRIGPAIYLWTGLPDDPMHELEAARRRLPAGAAFSGLTAAWLHGIDVGRSSRVEVTVPLRAGVSGRAGIAVRRSDIAANDLVQVSGMPATSMVRTIVDLCARLSLVEAVVIADASLHQRRDRLEDLRSWAASNSRRHGIRTMRRVIELVEPAAESAMESRLRMLLVLAGLPLPRAQVAIHDEYGRFVGRPDLYYDRHRLGIEYDGAVHRDSLAKDDRRQNRLLNAGVRLLRFTAADVLGDPDSVVTQVRAMLAHT